MKFYMKVDLDIPYLDLTLILTSAPILTAILEAKNLNSYNSVIFQAMSQKFCVEVYLCIP